MQTLELNLENPVYSFHETVALNIHLINEAKQKFPSGETKACVWSPLHVHGVIENEVLILFPNPISFQDWMLKFYHFYQKATSLVMRYTPLDPLATFVSFFALMPETHISQSEMLTMQLGSTN